LEHYLTVGLPIRGVPEGLRDTRDTRGRRVDPEGEVWSVLVDETAVQAAGWRRSQYTWIFRRNDDGHLELANTVLVSVVD
jgi:hypothetical protein